jgi:hypothetical protein
LVCMVQELLLLSLYYKLIKVASLIPNVSSGLSFWLSLDRR